MTGVETLLRWEHKDLETAVPMRFPLDREETGLIRPLTLSAEHGLRSERRVAAAGMPAPVLAMNLPARRFSDEMLLSDVAAMLGETGMPARACAPFTAAEISAPYGPP